MPFPGTPDPDAHLSEERVRSRAPLRARLHREGSLRARRRHGGDARRRVVLPLRGGGLGRHGQSDRRRGAARRRDGQLAVGPLREGVRQSRLQPGRARPHRVGRAQRADRRHARQLQHALRAAGRHRRAVRPGRRGPALVERLRRSRARPARVGLAPSLHRDEDVSEDHRDLRRTGDLVQPRQRRHRRHRPERRIFRFPTTSVATTIPARRTAAAPAASLWARRRRQPG